MAEKKGRASKSQDEKDKANAARAAEAQKLGVTVSVRFSVVEAEKLKVHADKAKRPMAYVVREAVLPLLT